MKANAIFTKIVRDSVRQKEADEVFQYNMQEDERIAEIKNEMALYQYELAYESNFIKERTIFERFPDIKRPYICLEWPTAYDLDEIPF